MIVTLNFDRITMADMERLLQWRYRRSSGFRWNKAWNPNIALVSEGNVFAVRQENQLVGLFALGSLIDAPQSSSRKNYLIRSDGYCPILIVINPDRADSRFSENFVLSGLSFAKEKFNVTKFRVAIEASDAEAIDTLKNIGFEEGGKEFESWIDGETSYLVLTKDSL